MANHEEYRVNLKAGLVPALTDNVRQLDAFFLDQQKLLPAHGAYHGAMEIAEAVHYTVSSGRQNRRSVSRPVWQTA